LRQFLREGTPWCSLRADAQKASGSTLRRARDRWAQSGLLVRVRALLVAMLRGDPDLILDSCSVRAKRGGDLTGPNPTDRGKRGTKYHVAITADGVPVACAATAATVNDTLLFERLFLAAWVVLARIRTVFADRDTMPSAIALSVAAVVSNRVSTSAASPTVRAWGNDVGRSRAAWFGCWRTGAWRCATIGSVSSSKPCSRAHVYSWLLAGSLANFENRP
jgi:hypothetical protein